MKKLNAQEYKSLYRVYRPSSFDEVKGQENIVETLKNILKNQKLTHAYLFSGPRGTGKTSVAKIFANTINCNHNNDLLTPCSFCIENINHSLDIIEMDAASNNGVDEIRDLKERIQNSPSHSNFKIYIIDEVHMLSKAAFNALLKTLEEPPKHVIFILATTDPQKIPLTILSRVQRFNFKRIDDSIIFEQLKFVLNEENIDFEEKALKIIAKLSNGGMRDALSMVDQVAIFGSNKVSEINVMKLFGLTSNIKAIELINLVAQAKIDLSLRLLVDLFNNGIDINSLNKKIINILKDYIVFFKTNDINLLEEININEVKELNLNLESAYNLLDGFVEIMKNLNQAYQDLNQIMELGILKICSNIYEIDKTHEKPNFNLNKQNNSEKTLNFKNVINQENNFSESRKTSLEKEENISFNNSNKVNEYENIFEKNIWETTTITIDDNDSKLEELKIESFVEGNIPQEEKKLDLNNIIDTNLIEKTTEFINLNNEINDQYDSVNESIVNTQEVNIDKTQNILETNQINLEKDNKISQEIPLPEIENYFHVEEKPKPIYEIIEKNHSTDEVKENSISSKPKIEEDIVTLEEVLNLFTLANKHVNDEEYKNKFKQNWEKIELYFLDEKYNKYTIILKEARLISFADDFILVSSKEEDIIWILNDYANDKHFKNLIKDIFGSSKHFFAISKDLFSQSKNKWLQLKRQQIELEPKPLPKIVEKTEQEETDQYLNDLFGEKFNF